MAIDTLKIGMEVSSNGSTEREIKHAKALKAAFDDAASSAAKMGGTAGSRAAAAKAMPTGSQALMSGQDYRGAQGIVQSEGGTSSRDFAKQAQGLGGLVHVYATFAANLFAVSAAFTALKNAADTENMVKGLDQLGARSGIALGSLSKRLVEATDGAVSLRDAMTATAQASAAGMSTESIERLAKVAKNAGSALGLDAAEALSRLSRGVTKLEPELLDELGIFIRIDDVVSEYARSVGKAGSAITDFEKRQAVAQAVLKQGEDKFGNLNIDANPYQKLLATIEDVAHGILNVVNTILGPVAKYLAESPSVVLGVLTMLTGYLLQKAVPAISQYSNAVAAAAEKELLLNKATSEAVSSTFKAKQKQLEDSKALYESIETDIEKIISKTEAAEMKALRSKSARGSKAVKDILGNAPTYSAEDIPPEKLAVIDALAAKNTKMAKTYAELAAGIRAYQEAEAKATQAAKDRTVAAELLAKSERDLAEAKSNLVKINTALALSEAKQKASKAGGLVAGFSTLFEEVGKVDASKFEKVKAGVSGGVGLIGSALSKALNFINPWIMGITAAIAVWDIADGVFSKNAKELNKLNGSIDALDDSLKNSTKTIETYTSMDVSKALPLERTKAMSTALSDLSSATSKVVADFKDMLAQSNGWDKAKQAVLGAFDLDKRTDVTKELSKSLAKAIALADEGPAKEEFKKKLEEITGSKAVSEAGIASALASKSADDYTASAAKLVEAQGELSKSQSTSTAKTVELSEAFKGTEKAFDIFAQSLQSNNAINVFANSLVQQSIKISGALEEPTKAIDNLVELSSKTKQLSLLDPKTVAELKTAMPVIADINKNLKTAQQELTQRQQERATTTNQADINFLDGRIKTLKGEVDKFRGQAELQVNYFLTKIQSDGFRVAADILSKEIVQASKQASIDVAKARLPLLTGERAAEQQGRLAEQQIQANVTLAETNRDLIRAHYLSIAAMKENTAQTVINSDKSTELQKTQAAKDLTSARIQTGLLQSENPVAAYGQLTSKGMPDEVKASANEVFQQLQNLSGFTKTIIELKGQLAATRESTNIAKVFGSVEDANKLLEATNNTKQAELARLQAVSQIVGFTTQEALAREKQLSDEIAINKLKIDSAKLEAANSLLDAKKPIEAKQLAVNNQQLAQIKKQAADDQFKRDMDYAKKSADALIYEAKIRAQADSDELETLNIRKKLSQDLADAELQAATQRNFIEEKTRANLEYSYGVAKAKADFDYQQGKQRIEQEQKFVEFDARRAQVATSGTDLDTKILQLAEINKQEAEYIALQGVKTARDKEALDTLLKKLGITKETTLELAKQKESMDDLASVTNSLAVVFGNVGKAVGDTAGAFANLAKNQKEREEQLSRETKGTKAYRDLQSKNAVLEVRDYATIASAAKSMFKEKTAAYKVFAAFEKAAHIASMIMTFQKMAADEAGTVATIANSIKKQAAKVAEASTDGVAAVVKAMASMPFPMNLAAGAATAAVVGALLTKIGGSGPGFTGGSENTGTGTVLGDKNAVSKSLSQSIEVLQKSDPILMNNSMGMLRHLRNIDQNISSLGVALIRALPGGGDIASEKFGVQSGFQGYGGMGTALLGAIPLVGGFVNGLIKSLGFGTSTSVKGQGIMAGPQSLAGIMSGGFQGSFYTDVNTKKKALGITYDSKDRTLTTALDDIIERTLTQIFTNTADAIISSSSILGRSTENISDSVNKFVINLGKINLSGLSTADQQAKFQGVVGAQLDKLVEFVYPEIVRFEKVGEGAAETLSRVAYGIESAQVGLESLGIKAIKFTQIVNDQGDIGAEIVRQSIMGNETQTFISQVIANADGAAEDIISLYKQLDGLRNTIVSLGVSQDFLNKQVIIAAGGTDAFTTSIEALYSKFTTESFKTQDATNKVFAVFNKLALAVPKSREEFFKMFKDLTKTAPESAGAVLKVIDSLDTMYSYMEKTSESVADMVTRLRDFTKSMSDFKSSLAIGQYSPLTPLEQYIKAKSNVEDAFAKAITGDKAAMAEFQKLATTALDLSKTVSASGSQYTADYYRINDMIDQLSSYATSQADIGQLQLDAQNTQIDILKQISENTAALTSIPTHAGGGLARGLSLVGEMGPELVNFENPGRVYTAEQTAGMFTPRSSNNNTFTLLVNELQDLRGEVEKLRKDQQKQTGDMIVTNYDATQKLAEQITEAVVQSVTDSSWQERSKSNLK